MGKIYKPEDLFPTLTEEQKKSLKPRGLVGLLKGKMILKEGDIFNLTRECSNIY